MGKSVTRFKFHRILYGLLILISLASTAAFMYFATHRGIFQVRGKTFPIPADAVALGSPIVGILALWLAVLTENHGRCGRFSTALAQTFVRLWWILAIVVVVIIWIWVTNNV